MELATEMRLIFLIGLVGVVSTVIPLATLVAWLKSWRERRAAALPHPPPASYHGAETERVRLEREIEMLHARWRLLC